MKINDADGDDVFLEKVRAASSTAIKELATNIEAWNTTATRTTAKTTKAKTKAATKTR